MKKEVLIEIHKGRIGKVYITREDNGFRVVYHVMHWYGSRLVNVETNIGYWNLSAARKAAIEISGETYAAY